MVPVLPVVERVTRRRVVPVPPVSFGQRGEERSLFPLLIVLDPEAKSGASLPVSLGKRGEEWSLFLPTFCSFSVSFCSFLPVLSSFMLPDSLLFLPKNG